MRNSTLTLAVSLGSLLAAYPSAYSQEVMSAAAVQEAADQLAIGETFQISFSIAKGDWGSRSKDVSTSATYTAPVGTVILGSTLERKGHHSWVAGGELKQADQLSYDIGILANLTDKAKEGFLKGALTWKG